MKNITIDSPRLCSPNHGTDGNQSVSLYYFTDDVLDDPEPFNVSINIEEMKKLKSECFRGDGQHLRIITRDGKNEYLSLMQRG
jgi:hypothetical protein